MDWPAIETKEGEVIALALEHTLTLISEINEKKMKEKIAASKEMIEHLKQGPESDSKKDRVAWMEKLDELIDDSLDVFEQYKCNHG